MNFIIEKSSLQFLLLNTTPLIRSFVNETIEKHDWTSRHMKFFKKINFREKPHDFSSGKSQKTSGLTLHISYFYMNLDDAWNLLFVCFTRNHTTLRHLIHMFKPSARREL